MKTLARPALRSAATSISTMAGVRIRALTERHPIKPTSPRCHSAWQLNLGRYSTYRRGKSVQTTGTTSSLEAAGPSAESQALAERLAEPRFGYLSEKDRRLLADAVALRCEAFLTMERRLPRNAAHLARELGLAVLTPVGHWEMLCPWAALWL